MTAPVWSSSKAGTGAFFIGMFTYGLLTGNPNPAVDYPRLLVSDTQQFDAAGNRAYVWEDEEIIAAANIQASFFQSAAMYSPPAGATLPTSPVSYLRVAALLLDAMAANSSRLAGVTKLLDISLDVSKAADALRAQAQRYRDTDDDSGAFAIIEQCSTSWGVADRFWAQVQRQSGIM